MKRFTTFILYFACIAILLSSCSLFRKIKSTRIPPPVTKQPLPKEEKPAPAEKEAALPAPFHVKAFAKKVFRPVYNVALFTPLYLDQVTSDTAFSVNSRTPLPGPALAGLEFYEGALLALDSLQQQGIALHLFVYDTKSTSKPLSRILHSNQLDSTNLMIGAVGSDAFKEISDVAKQKQINFISATYPNDAGIRENPFVVIVNSTLRVHCHAIQDFAQQKFSDKNILVVYQNNAQEKQNLQYMQEAYNQMRYSRKSPLHPIEWKDTSATNLLPHLSKDKNNVIVLTALYPQVALSIIGQLVPLAKTYRISVVGMPTLDGNQNLKKPEYNGIDIYYSTPYPYSNAASVPAIRSMMWQFFRKYRSRPSDMALKGYETLFYFAELLRHNGMYFNKALNSNTGHLLTDFEFRPIYKTGGDKQPPDYFENTHLYFMKIRDGKVMRAN
jgi:ABC-type branched-subunit amino acid transport system substrate-binding protein